MLTTKYTGFTKIEIYVSLTAKKSDEYTVPYWYGLMASSGTFSCLPVSLFPVCSSQLQNHLQSQGTETVAIASYSKMHKRGRKESKRERNCHRISLISHLLKCMTITGTRVLKL